MVDVGGGVLQRVAMIPISPRPRNGPGTLDVGVAGVRLTLRPCGALWWAGARLLVVSDLHLEKGSSYAQRGQMLPPYDTRVTLARVAGLVEDLAPATVISLGDSFHDRLARFRMAADDIECVRNLTARCDWVWIEGNHDPLPPDDFGGRLAHELTLGPLVFRHAPTQGAAEGEIAGHLHPCARVVGRGGQLRARCFATDGTRMVMPAYGALTGGLNILDPAFAPLFPNGVQAAVMGRDGVYAARDDRLAPDAVRAAG